MVAMLRAVRCRQRRGSIGTAEGLASRAVGCDLTLSVTFYKISHASFILEDIGTFLVDLNYGQTMYCGAKIVRNLHFINRTVPTLRLLTLAPETSEMLCPFYLL